MVNCRALGLLLAAEDFCIPSLCLSRHISPSAGDGLSAQTMAPASSSESLQVIEMYVCIYIYIYNFYLIVCTLGSKDARVKNMLKTVCGASKIRPLRRKQ